MMKPVSQAAPSSTTGALHLLKTVFGYDSFRGFQAEVIAELLEGRDALVLMPTGGGKSLCYQLPSLLRTGVGVVISPLIALMQDQVDALKQLGIRAAFLNSSLTAEAQQSVEAACQQGKLDVLYVAPERALTARFSHLLRASEVALFAIDECHCVSQWGHDFRPEYTRLKELTQHFPEVPRIALTATADAHTRADIVQVLGLERAATFVASFDRPNIHYTVVNRQNAKAQLLEFYRAAQQGNAGIVYTHTRREAEETAAWLRQEGVNALPYHAGLSAMARQQHQHSFLRQDGVVICATVAFGMGINKPDVRFVAHLGLPKTLEAYYQETGRAGRDGEHADAFMIYGLNDAISIRRMIDTSAAPEAIKHIEAQKLERLVSYCETASCRRQLLLHYFGETLAAPCGNCDTCLHPKETWDGTIEAQKVLSTIYRTGQRFGAGHIVDVLRGKETPKVLEYRHETLSTFGIGLEHPAQVWRGIIRQLVAFGYLHTAVGQYAVLKLAPKSNAVLRAQTPVFFHSDLFKETKRTPKSSGTAAADVDETLYEALRQHRKALADEEDVPAFVIFSNKTLEDMTRKQPRSAREMLEVQGVGEVKLRRYGDGFLQVIAAYLKK